MKINCKQFENLMIFHIDNELKEGLKQAFESHLLVCRKCRHKYNTFREIIMDIRKSYKNIKNKNYSLKVADSKNEIITKGLSAYVDNELELSENIKIKKMIITKPNLRKKVENIYKIQNLLKESFAKTKLTEDYSKFLVKQLKINKICNENKEILVGIISFLSLCLIWIIMLFATISV